MTGNEIGLWALLIAASITDLIWGKIFNWLNFSFLLAGIAFRVYSHGPGELVSAVSAVAVAFVLFYPLYLMKTLAAGDIKLLMAVGAWSDPRLVIELGIIAILVGALVGGFILLRKTGLKGGFKSVWAHARSAGGAQKSHRMPFAPAFLCGLMVLHIAQRYQWSVL